MIHSNLVGKKFTSIFWHFVFSATSSNVHQAPKRLCHQFITHKIKYETIFSRDGYGTHHVQKFMEFFQNVTMWLKTFTFFFGLKIWTNVKNKMKRECLITFKKRKNSLNLQKIENHVATFPYWFWFGNNILSV
jgi:hypothetical protein